MLLRTALEERLPVKGGEKKLSEQARQTVFRGKYCLSPRNSLIAVEDWKHSDGTHSVNPRRRWRGPSHDVYEAPLHQETDAESGAFGFVLRFEGKQIDVLAEMTDPAAIARFNRVESVARRIKTTIVSTLLIAGAATAVSHISDWHVLAESSSSFSPPEVSPSYPGI